MIVAPSILSADWSRLEDAVRIAESGADWLHCDVMDGHFVPNLTFGPPLVSALGRLTRLPLDVHLMIEEPLAFVPAFVDAGAAVITLHVEARGVAGPGWPAPVRARGEGGARAADAPRPGSAAGAATRGANPVAAAATAAAAAAHPIDFEMLARAVALVRAGGAQVGLALRPDTGLDEVEPLLRELDVLLLMTVYPGFSGQAFLEDQLVKVRAAAEWKRMKSARYLVEVDGGVTAEDTGPRLAHAGAEVVVAGHGVYRQRDPVAAIRALKALA